MYGAFCGGSFTFCDIVSFAAVCIPASFHASVERSTLQYAAAVHVSSVTALQQTASVQHSAIVIMSVRL